MKRNKTSLVQAWLKRSLNDFEAALLLSVGGEQNEIVLFHLQQSVEKSIKAYLIWHEVTFPHIHDIERLLDEAIQLDNTFAQWDRLSGMSIFAVAGRYPESDHWIEECAPADWMDDVKLFYQFVCLRVEAS